jgi:hypothetical protein
VAVAWRKTCPRTTTIQVLANAVRACPLDADIRVIPAPEARP